MLPKKLLKLLIFAAGCLALVFCGEVPAVQGDSVSLQPPITIDRGDPNSGGLDFKGIIERIAGVIFWLGLLICPIAIIWGGFEIATAGGDQNKITKGKQIIQYSVVGLLTIGISMTFATVIKDILD